MISSAWSTELKSCSAKMGLRNLWFDRRKIRKKKSSTEIVYRISNFGRIGTKSKWISGFGSLRNIYKKKKWVLIQRKRWVWMLVVALISAGVVNGCWYTFIPFTDSFPSIDPLLPCHFLIYLVTIFLTTPNTWLNDFILNIPINLLWEALCELPNYIGIVFWKSVIDEICSEKFWWEILNR